MNYGVAFEYEVRESAKAFQIYYQKIPSGGVRGEGETRFVRANPYDGYLVMGGIYCPVELKSYREWGAWPLDRLLPHQVEGMQGALHHGACPFIMVNFRRTLGKMGKLVPANRAFVIPFSRLKNLTEEARAAGRVSVPWKWFEGGVAGHDMPRLPKSDKQPPVWDLPTALARAARSAGHPAYLPLVTVLETGFYGKRSWERVGSVAR